MRAALRRRDLLSPCVLRPPPATLAQGTALGSHPHPGTPIAGAGCPCTGTPRLPWLCPTAPGSPTAAHGGSGTEEAADGTRLWVTTVSQAKGTLAQVWHRTGTAQDGHSTGPALASGTPHRAPGQRPNTSGCKEEPTESGQASTRAGASPWHGQGCRDRPCPAAPAPGVGLGSLPQGRHGAIPLPAPAPPAAWGSLPRQGDRGHTREVPAAPRSPQPPGPYKAARSSHVAPDLVCF